jgi:signal transduction histidine kinase
MTALRRPSLVRRLIIWQIVAMAVAWLALSAWILFQMAAYSEGDLDRRMNFFAQSLAEAGSAAVAAGDNAAQLKRRLTSTEKNFIDGVIGAPNATQRYVPVYQLWAADGRLLYASAAAPPSPLAEQRRGFSQASFDGHDFRVVAAMSSDVAVRATVGESISQRLLANGPMLLGIGSSQLLILLWIVAVTWFAARRGFKPLTTLATQVSLRQPGDLSPLDDGRAYAETGPIVQEINSLLAREGRRLETERGFLADAAHELRTPLAAINVQAHVLVTTADAATRQAATLELQQGIERVSHLLSQLLTLARLEAGPLQGAMGAYETVDIAELCRQRMADLSQLARARAVSLALDAPDALLARVQRAGFMSIVDNLVDNAIRYTPSGGEVQVQLSMDDSGVGLAVRDNGPGIAPADRERVFERFVRLPHSAEQGSGLGLAIVQRVVASQAATLRFVEGLSGRGVGFMVRFPQASPFTTVNE